MEIKYHPVSMNSYCNHYIKINHKLEKQNYFMPVISVEEKGDICFNLDGISFEFYLYKEDFLKLKELDQFLSFYQEKINIYEFTDCTIDLYQKGETLPQLAQNIKNSKEQRLGLSIDCSSFPQSQIIEHFEKVCSFLSR